MDNVQRHNRDAWDREVDQGNPWTIPVSSDEIARAKAGDWRIVLTPTKPVPSDWYPPLQGADVLCLASGGGQQGPILAAVGANVTVLDNAPKQLARDELVAKRDGLTIRLVQGDMRAFPELEDESFDMIVHPVSNCFVDTVLPVWRECARVLRPGGILIAGYSNPVRYLFGDEHMHKEPLTVKQSIPHSDVTCEDPYTQKLIADGEPLEFGHTLEDQIGGQLRAGLVLTHFFEDHFEPENPNPMYCDPLSRYIDTFISSRAVKPS